MDKEKLYTWIRANTGASFSEIECFFDENHYEWRGDYDIEHFPGSNVIFWTGWSYEAARMIVDLTQEERVGAIPVSPIIALTFGAYLKLPIAKQVNRCYKKKHWLPVVVKCI